MAYTEANHHKQLQCQRDHYRRRKESYRAALLRRRAKNREWVASYKATHACVKCGESHPACLEFHHIDRSIKELEISRAIHLWGLERLKAEAVKCVLICSNCHQKHHWEERHQAGVLVQVHDSNEQVASTSTSPTTAARLE